MPAAMQGSALAWIKVFLSLHPSSLGMIGIDSLSVSITGSIILV